MAEPFTQQGTPGASAQPGAPGLTAFPLKAAAIITMTVDHAGYVFADVMPYWAFCLCIAFGGLTFPLMAFFITEGERHTSNIRRYAARLLIFACVAQIPYGLFLNDNLNVLFTLLIGLGLVHLERTCSKRWLYGLAVAAGIVASYWCDWGVIGPIIVLAFVYARKEGEPNIFMQSVGAAAAGANANGAAPMGSSGAAGASSSRDPYWRGSLWNNASEPVGQPDSPATPATATVPATPAAAVAAATAAAPLPAEQSAGAPRSGVTLTQQQRNRAALAALVAGCIVGLMCLTDFALTGGLSNLAAGVGYVVGGAVNALLIRAYNGQRGRSIKYFFYIYYPAHIALLGLAHIALFG